MITKPLFPAVLFFTASCFVLAPGLFAQQPRNEPDMNIDAATRSAVLENLFKDLIDGYVFAEIAGKMESNVKLRVSAKEYENLTSAQAFAEKLTQDLQRISKDKHLRVRFSPQPSN